jgi:hypothetical protein
MKGYPKHINCQQDYINLLAEPELKAQALEDLKAIRDLDDSKVLRVVSMNEKTGEAKTEEIDNPMPLWKVKGFRSRQDVADLIADQEENHD